MRWLPFRVFRMRVRVSFPYLCVCRPRCHETRECARRAPSGQRRSVTSTASRSVSQASFNQTVPGAVFYGSTLEPFYSCTNQYFQHSYSRNSYLYRVVLVCPACGDTRRVLSLAPRATPLAIHERHPQKATPCWKQPQLLQVLLSLIGARWVKASIRRSRPVTRW